MEIGALNMNLLTLIKRFLLPGPKNKQTHTSKYVYTENPNSGRQLEKIFPPVEIPDYEEEELPKKKRKEK